MKKRVSSFFEEVYELVKQIPEGRVVTYGEIASVLGTKDARRVGHALHANPYEGEVPCHRVVNKQGRVSESFAFDGSDEQIKRLESEGVGFLDRNHVDLEKFEYVFEKN